MRGEDGQQEDEAEEAKKEDNDTLYTEIRQDQDLSSIPAGLGISQITGKDYLGQFQKHSLE